jgi:Tfp pilus assembly protein PilF
MLKWPAFDAPARLAQGAPASSHHKAVRTKKPENLLASGLDAYENGNYRVAEAKLHAALDAGGTATDQITAHKHVAFIACATEKWDACEGHFRQALSLDRKFTLTAAEVGHPAWGPVFKKVKAEAARKAAA